MSTNAVNAVWALMAASGGELLTALYLASRADKYGLRIEIRADAVDVAEATRQRPCTVRLQIARFVELGWLVADPDNRFRWRHVYGINQTWLHELGGCAVPGVEGQIARRWLRGSLRKPSAPGKPSAHHSKAGAAVAKTPRTDDEQRPDSRPPPRTLH